VHFVNIEGGFLSKFRYNGFWRSTDWYTVDMLLCPGKLKLHNYENENLKYCIF